MSSDTTTVSQGLPQSVELPLVYVIITHTEGYIDDEGKDRYGTVSIYVTQKGNNGRQGPVRMFYDTDKNKMNEVEALKNLITNNIRNGKLGKAKVLMPKTETNPLHVETFQDTWSAIMTANNFFRTKIIGQIYKFPIKASDSDRSGDLHTIYPVLPQGGRRTIPKSSRKYKKSAKRVFRKKSRSTRRR
jgi:hypothetical protein